MAIVDLSGTPVVRYPDPTVPRVLPNGVQPYSAYEAPLVYMSASKGGPSSLCNTVLNKLPVGNTVFNGLLFGTDYPASILPVEYMRGVIVDNAGLLLPIADPSFVGSPWQATDGAVVFDSLIPSTETYADLRYKQIVRGLTRTNSVDVSGFPVVGEYTNYGLFGDEEQTKSPQTYFSLRVLMNGAVINSSTPFVGQTYQPAPVDINLPTSAPNFPIILWEKQFTQDIVDDGFKISGALLFGVDDVPATLDVVGIWRSATYSPIPSPIP